MAFPVDAFRILCWPLLSRLHLCCVPNRTLQGLGYPWGSMDPRGFGWIWNENFRKLRFGLGYGLRNESFYMLMDNGLDLGNIFAKSGLGTGLAFL